MKAKNYLLSLLFLSFFSFSNAQIIELTFTGKSGSFHVPLDSILIENLTHAGDTMLYSPDTVIVLGTVGINDGFDKNDFMVLQNYPNPFKDQTYFDIYLPDADHLDVSVYNAIGKEISSYENDLSNGMHSFTFNSGNEQLYFLTVRYKSEVKTIKMTAVSSDQKQKCDLSYNGLKSDKHGFKSQKSSKGFIYTFGDQLKFIGYAGFGSDTIIDAPTFDVTYEFEFDMGIPCPELPSFVYGGQTYNTIKIGTQCWMKENLNIGARIDGNIAQTDNGIIEKYCYDDNTANCDEYGGLYMWNEIMDYQIIENIQGICPSGWHIPSDSSWTVLTDYLGGNNIAGYRMKEAGPTHWSPNNFYSNNLSGFTALPAAYSSAGLYYEIGEVNFIWSSTELGGSDALGRQLRYNNSQAIPVSLSKSYGMSVRCLKDTCSQLPTQANAGPDSLDIAGDSIVLMANTPVYGQGMWSIAFGVGGSFSDVTDPSSVFYGQPGNTYTLKWKISTACASNHDYVQLSFANPTPQPCPGIPTFIYGGQTYNTVLVGNQCWMKENLNIGLRIDGSQTQTNNAIIEKYCYGDDTSNCSTYGGLYQWNEMMDYVTSIGAQGICAAGWHIPTDGEWKILEGTVDSQYGVGSLEWDNIGYRGSDVAHNLKSTTGWNFNGNGNDLYGFTVLPAGYHTYAGVYDDIGNLAHFWSSEYSTNYGWIRDMSASMPQVYRSLYNDVLGLSVRCLKDSCFPPPTQANAGPDSLNIAGDSIVLMGNTPVSGQGLWSIFSGIGGSFADPTSPTTMFYGLPGYLYNLVWTITTNCGSSSDTVKIYFASPGFVCGDPLIDTRDWQSYKTVQIDTLCWMAENLNIGSMVNGSNDQFDNGVIEKYCYDDIQDSCTIYGGFYQWDEMMQYDTIPGTQGICPAGWHIPSDDEWKYLEGTVDSQYSVGDPEWDLFLVYRGFDAGLNLKSSSGWSSGGNGNDMYGFFVLPGGYRYTNNFYSIGYNTYFWSSSEYNSTKAWRRELAFDNSGVYRYYTNKKLGFSVRCLKD